MPEIKHEYVSPVGSFRMKISVGNLDITDYVMSGQIERSINNPTGKWTLHLRPILEGKTIKRLPVGMNDYVEINLDRSNVVRPADKPQSSRIRIAMRGFLDNEAIEEQSSGGLEGIPQRSYVLSGSDVGKLLERRQIFIPPGYNDLDIRVGLQKFTEYFKSAEFQIVENAETQAAKFNTRRPSNYQPLEDWVGYFLNVVYKGEFETMVQNSQNSADFSFNFIPDLPKLGRVNGNETESQMQNKIYVELGPLMNNTNSTSFWNFIQLYCVKPFIETFITEQNQSTNFHLRWSPFRRRYKAPGDLEYTYEFPRQFTNKQKWFREELTARHIRTTDVLVRSLRRQESDRGTYFFTRLQQLIDTSAQTSTSSTQTAQNTSVKEGSNPYYDREGMSQFGIRPVVIDLPWWPALANAPAYSTPPSDGAAPPVNYRNFVGVDITTSLQDFTTWLVDTLTFTDDLYTGYITVLGNTDIQLGEELYIDDLNEFYYIESLEHTWSVFPNPYFLTRIGVTRGAMYSGFTSPEKNYNITGKVLRTDEATGNTVIARSRVNLDAIDIGT